MFILKKEHQPGVYVPLRALFLVLLFMNVIWNIRNDRKMQKNKGYTCKITYIPASVTLE